MITMIRRCLLPLIFCLMTAGMPAANPPYEIAAYYFPNYHPNPQNEQRYGKGWTEWTLLKAAQPRFPGHEQPKTPLWGYEDESQPAIFEKKIDAAADHGVTAFIFDWYWHNSGPFLERGLDQGFLQAKNRQRLKFSLMWANHDWLEIFPARPGVKQDILYPGPVTRETFNAIVRHVIKNYFSQPNYWKIEGRPYFSIYETMTLVKGLGGLEATRRALDDFRAQTKAAGFPGLHLNAVAWGVQINPGETLVKTPEELTKFLGLDSITTYSWIHHAGLTQFPTTPYADWLAQSVAQWKEFSRKWPVAYHPNVSMGWDSSPRTLQTGKFENLGYPFTPVVTGNQPAAFQQALEQVKAFLDEQKAGPKIFTINAWNEWTEGSYLEPDTVHKMDYLKAIRAVFGN